MPPDVCTQEAHIPDLISTCKSTFLEVDWVRVELSFSLIDDFIIPRPSRLTIEQQFFVSQIELHLKETNATTRNAWSNQEKLSLLLGERYASKGVNITHYQWKLNVKRKIKGALSALGQFLSNESHLKIMKNAFDFISKAIFVLKIF